ncbi:MAG: ATP-dependent chaperone ClpB [Amphiamblys sp. WSBS2006]|nr:MAG: ATP-dependent chaperone ClpB [Amphiamblys sp. WSBS2006]
MQQKKAEMDFANLRKYAIDLTKMAEDGKLDPVIGRDEEIRRVMLVLSRRTKNNPVLIGPPGVGKTAVAEGVAQRMAEGDVPEMLSGRLFSLDMGAVVAGAKYQGEFEERLKGVLDDIKNAKERVFLFIDELHVVLGAGKTGGAMDAANLLKPMLARGELRCIGATTLDEYRKYVEKDPAFERRFQQVYVEEPSVEDTISILRGLKEKYETHHGVRILDDGIVAAAKLSQRYIQGRYQPDKSIDLIDEACAGTRISIDSQPEEIDVLMRKKRRLEIEGKALEKEPEEKERLGSVLSEIARVEEELRPLVARYSQETERLKELRVFQKKLDMLRRKRVEAEHKGDIDVVADLDYYSVPDVQRRIKELSDVGGREHEGKLVSEVITKEKVAEVVARWTGIPVSKIGLTQAQKLLGLRERLSQAVIGQEEGVRAVSEAIIRSRSGLGHECRPVGGFLFLGSTGVGKTELARCLSYELFDEREELVRVDMSEYMEAHSVSRLIGAPPGYVGYDEGGQLTERVRRRPYCVLLLDEIEKAHPQVLNILLQLLDDGAVTDGQGRRVDFTNTVVILTFNIGSEYLSGVDTGSSAAERERAKAQALYATQQTIRAEILNRLDEIVVFNPLGVTDMELILRKQVSAIEKRLGDRQIKLSLSPEAARRIISESYSPQYGARPLRRYLERNVATEIGKLILSGRATKNAGINILPRDTQEAPGSEWHATEKFLFQVTSVPETFECAMAE